jgi:hypothetical protein
VAENYEVPPSPLINARGWTAAGNSSLFGNTESWYNAVAREIGPAIRFRRNVKST